MATNAFHIIFSIALIFAITMPSSLGHRELHKQHHHEKSDIEEDLRDLCSKTRKSEECWKIIKWQLDRFDDNNWQSVEGIVIDLAIAKANEIHEKLNGYYRHSNDDKLKEKYLSCSKNYNDAIRNMDLAKRNLDSDDCQNISAQIDDTVQELESCKREFDRDSFDPGHVGDRNKEFGNYVDIVKAAADRLLRENEGN